MSERAVIVHMVVTVAVAIGASAAVLFLVPVWARHDPRFVDAVAGVMSVVVGAILIMLGSTYVEGRLDRQLRDEVRKLSARPKPTQWLMSDDVGIPDSR